MKNEPLERIILNPKIMAGKPIVRGTRLTIDASIIPVPNFPTPTSFYFHFLFLTDF
ncbi:hypothetical protein TUMEXPCC7403_14070 [Tumidithrix helvetica PCC 7403]|uniref:DUF433 domain-containing protein n=1 Tax=Tumidithrix helvetica TaxID=3457545 RepID=UPI003C80E554